MKAALLGFAFTACLCAQQPHVENAKLESRPFTGTIAAQLLKPGAGPFWAGWAEPIAPGRHGDMCNHYMETPVRLEGQTAVVVLVRMENATVDQLRVASPDCHLDAGGLPFVWLDGVPPAESIAWLNSQTTGNHPDTAIMAIGLHSDASAERALEALTAIDRPERIREKAAFWLGTSRGAHGVEVLKRMLAADPSQRVREQVVFALSQSPEPAGIAAVLEAARNDQNPRVRSRALFWLAQKAANQQTQETIGNAILNDPDRTVKEQAVFALTQLPGDQGVPLLINVAKSNSDPAVRKKAMFWLGQSTDRRALDFFAQVLKQ